VGTRVDEIIFCEPIHNVVDLRLGICKVSLSPKSMGNDSVVIINLGSGFFRGDGAYVPFTHVAKELDLPLLSVF
jgi:hypothetical protein